MLTMKMMDGVVIVIAITQLRVLIVCFTRKVVIEQCVQLATKKGDIDIDIDVNDARL